MFITHKLMSNPTFCGIIILLETSVCIGLFLISKDKTKKGDDRHLQEREKALVENHKALQERHKSLQDYERKLQEDRKLLEAEREKVASTFFFWICHVNEILISLF